MAAITGYTGSVTMPTGFNAIVTGFALNITIDIIDITSFSDSGWKNVVEGCKAATGSITGFCDNASGNTPYFSGDSWSGSLYLVADTGCTFSGPALFTSININRPTCASATANYNFQFLGKPTVVWAS